MRIEAIECCAIVFPLVENRFPTESGLRTLKDKKLEEAVVVV